jgi:hypothetical protein
MIPFIAGLFAGTFAGVALVAFGRAGHQCDCQVPTLGRGTWLVVIDEHGELAKCQPHVCIDEAFKRLGKSMGDES